MPHSRPRVFQKILASVGPDGKVYVCNNGGLEWRERGGLTLPGNQAADYTGGSIQRVDLETGRAD